MSTNPVLDTTHKQAMQLLSQINVPSLTPTLSHNCNDLLLCQRKMKSPGFALEFLRYAWFLVLVSSTVCCAEDISDGKISIRFESKGLAPKTAILEALPR